MSTCGGSTGSKNAKRRYSLTTDIIIGFPGETDGDFQQTLDLLDEVQYDSSSASSIRAAQHCRAFDGNRIPKMRSSAAC